MKSYKSRRKFQPSEFNGKIKDNARKFTSTFKNYAHTRIAVMCVGRLIQTYLPYHSRSALAFAILLVDPTEEGRKCNRYHGHGWAKSDSKLQALCPDLDHQAFQAFWGEFQEPDRKGKN